MSGDKHTPGPWECYFWGSAAWELEDNEHPFIVTAKGDNTIIQSDANAYLIAAAPELLEALKRTINFGRAMADATDDKWLREAVLNDVAKAQAAIAKAEGRTDD